MNQDLKYKEKTNMKNLVIKKIDHYDYLLQDGKKKNYMINIQFYDINTIIEVNDILYIDEKLLKEKMLNIGLFNDPCGRNIETSEDKDIVILQTKQNRFYLKRIYG